MDIVRKLNPGLINYEIMFSPLLNVK